MILDGIDFDSKEVKEALKDHNSDIYKKAKENAKTRGSQTYNYLRDKAVRDAKEKVPQPLKPIYESANIKPIIDQQRAKVLRQLLEWSPKGTTLEQLAEKYKHIKDIDALTEKVQKHIKYAKNKSRVTWNSGKPIEFNWKALGKGLGSLGKGLLRGGIEAAPVLLTQWGLDKLTENQLRDRYAQGEFSENDLNAPITSGADISKRLAMYDLMHSDSYQDAIAQREKQAEIQELKRQELAQEALTEAGYTDVDPATFDLENQISNADTEWYHAVDSRPEYSYSPWERDKDLMDQYEAQDAAEYREKVKKRALEKINKYHKKRTDESKTSKYDGYIGYSDLI